MKKISAKLLLLLLITGMASCKKDMGPEPPANKKETEQAFMGGDYWTQLAIPEMTVPGSQPSDFSNIPFSANNYLYVILPGYNHLWQYDFTISQWVLKQSSFFNFPLQSGDSKYVFTYGNTIYFVNTITKRVRQYDLSTAQWSNKANFPGSASFCVNSNIYCDKRLFDGWFQQLRQ